MYSKLHTEDDMMVDYYYGAVYRNLQLDNSELLTKYETADGESILYNILYR